ncbi:MAG: hypothetical protein U0W24_02295 [Bacteroidales bacterium]
MIERSENGYIRPLFYFQITYYMHEIEIYWLKVEPLFRDLHGEARFDNLISKIGWFSP